MFNIMNLNNIENIFYWTDNNGAVSLPGDTALTYRTKSDQIGPSSVRGCRLQCAEHR